MADFGSVQSLLQGIKASLDQVEQMLQAPAHEGEGGGDSGPHGFQPHEVAMISGVLRASGAYAHVSNPDAFLGNFLSVVQAAPQPTGPADLRSFFDAALAAYSNGSVAPFPDAVIDAAWAAFTQQSA